MDWPNGRRPPSCPIKTGAGWGILADRILSLIGDSLQVLPTLTGPYDLIFCDADIGHYPEELPHYRRLLQPGGVLLSANLFLGQYVPELPDLDKAALYRERVLDESQWVTAFVGEKTLSVVHAAG